MAGDNIIRNFDEVLNAELGMPGSPEREAARMEAEAFYAGQILK